MPGTTPAQRRRGSPQSGPPLLGQSGVLLDGDAGPGALERLLGLVGGLLVGLVQDGLGRAVDQVLGLLETQAGELANDLDDLDLLVAGRLEDDVELLLLGGGLVATAARGGHTRSGHGDRSSRSHAEGLLELLHEVGDLDQRLLLQGLDALVVGQGGHGVLLQLVDVASPATSVSAGGSVASATACAAAPESVAESSPAASSAAVSGVSSTPGVPSVGSSASAAASGAAVSATGSGSS